MGEGVTTQIPEHAHCSECGQAIPPEAEVCGPDCREEKDSRRRKQRIWMAIFYGALVVAVLGFLGRNVL